MLMAEPIENITKNANDISGTYKNNVRKVFTKEEQETIDMIHAIRDICSRELMDRMQPQPVLEVA
jgi:hypothetical protein